MSSWAQITAAYGDLSTAIRGQAHLSEPWRRYAELVRTKEQDPPYHLRPLLNALRRCTGAHDRLVIVEHGYGSAATLLYLLALGYRGIHGVDIGGDCECWNHLVREACGIREQRFFLYGGTRLPFPDASVDFIFSQQVLEHVAPERIDSYYGEEARVLRAGGIAYHQVPHRLVPYESHMRAWFVHYFPRRLASRVYRLLGRDAHFHENHLFLRSRRFHFEQLRRYFGHSEDLTARRLRELELGTYYDGPTRLRRAAAKVVRAPLVGRPMAAAMSRFVMLETLSVKQY